MRIIDGIIAEATEAEMFDYYLTRDWDTVMSFREWLRRCEEQGTKVTDKEETDKEEGDAK